jgi:transposase
MAKTVGGTRSWKIEIVKRPNLRRFVVLTRRWIIERTFAWISRNRRLARGFKSYMATVAALVSLATNRLVLKRLTKPTYCL